MAANNRSVFTTCYSFHRPVYQSPWSYGPGDWINDRIHLHILLILVPWLVPDMGWFFRLGFTVALVAICLIHLGRSTYDQAGLNGKIAELTSGAHLMEAHTTYTIRCPNWNQSPALGRVEYVTPYVHAMAFYGMYQDDIRHLANYEASFNYFPISRFYSQSYAGQEDYVIAWMYPAEEKFADLKPNYQLIYQSKSKNLKLFQRQQVTVVALSGWRRENGKQLAIHFDFQPTGGETAEDHHAIGKDTNYVSGQFGGVTRKQHQGNKKIGLQARDFVWDTDDAAFKINLPNGTYAVTNYF